MVEEDVAFDPENVDFLGATRVVFDAEYFANLVEESAKARFGRALTYASARSVLLSSLDSMTLPSGSTINS